jgi:hypothetical protein
MRDPLCDGDVSNTQYGTVLPSTPIFAPRIQSNRRNVSGIDSFAL